MEDQNFNYTWAESHTSRAGGKTPFGSKVGGHCSWSFVTGHTSWIEAEGHLRRREGSPVQGGEGLYEFSQVANSSKSSVLL